MKSSKKIVMSVTACENPTDGRRRAELATNSKYLCEQIGMGYPATLPISGTCLTTTTPFTFYLAEDCTPNKKVKKIIDELISQRIMVGISWKLLDKALLAIPEHYRHVVKSELTKTPMDVDLAKYHDEIITKLGLE